jgi:hypothetical protein
VVTTRTSPLWLILLSLVCGGLAAQEASVEASVDRATIRENESFTYTVRVEGSVRGDPSVNGLTDNFDILNRSTNTRIQIINGRTEQIAEWQYQLMPRAAGTYVLPPAQIAGLVSNDITVEVLAGLPPGDELADIFMEVEALPQSAYVQSQIIFTLRLFVGIGTGRATLSTPEIDGVEAIVERLGEDANYSTVRGGRNFVVRERSYAVFAQEPGDLTIGPVVFEVMVIPNRGFSRVQRYSSDTVTVDVLPAVAPPAEYPQAVWLPARRVELSERWSEDVAALEMGIPLTRALTIEADGLLETQLPDLEIVQAEGIRQYADQPELDRSVTNSGLTVQRTERFAVIAQQAGMVELPAVELPWWNVDARQWEVATIEPRALEVLPSTEAVAPAAEQAEAVPVETAAEVQDSASFPWLSMFLAAGWLATALAWLYTARVAPRRAANASQTARGSARGALSRLQRACAGSDPEAARDALLEWAANEATFADCNSLGAVAEHLPEEAASAVEALERQLYSAASSDWDGAQLGACVSVLRRMKERSGKKSEDPLPSLYS